MAEREGPPNNRNLIPVEIPKKTTEIKVAAQALAQGLINDPTLIPDLFNGVENYGLSDNQAAFKEAKGQMSGFLSAVGKEIDTFDWPRKRDDKLSLEAGRTILLYLHPLDQKTKPTRQQKIVERIADGWLNRRFEKKPVNDWRKATLSVKDFLDSAVFPEVDLEALTNWFNLMVGKYPRVMARNDSVAWRSLHLSARAVTPYDESILEANSVLQKALSLTSELLNRRGEYQESSKAYMAMTAQFTTLLSMLDEGIDPFTKLGLNVYQKTMILGAKSQGIAVSKSMCQEIPLDLMEIINDTCVYPDRFIKLMKAIDQSYYANQAKATFLTPVDYDLTPEGDFEYPYNILFKPSPELDAIQALVEGATIKQSLYEITQQKVTERGGGRIVPFSIQGLQGYVILDNTRYLSPKDAVKRIAELIEKHQVRKLWEAKKGIQTAEAVSIGFNFPDCVFELFAKEYSTKTSLTSLLDLRIPDEILRKTDKVFEGNLSLERSIPPAFTRMPTLIGDKYDLVDHLDLPGVIESAVIKKTPTGGLEYTLAFVTDPMVFPDGEPPVTTGSVNFKLGRVNVVPDENFSNLPVSYRWILKGVILNLVERSCCPTLKEIEEERQEYENSNSINNQSIPGYIGHVGGFRASGERKQYTKEAEKNFGDTVGSLYDETAGISLGRLNDKHRQEDPGDDRFLTFYKGKESNKLQEPKLRKSPDRLISVV